MNSSREIAQEKTTDLKVKKQIKTNVKKYK
jgi:hypothetical protein